MKKNACAPIALITVLVLLFAAPGAMADEKSETRARLDAGEIIVQTSDVKGSSTPRVKAMGVVDTPAPRIWSIIERCGDYKTTMIRTAESEELSRSGSKVRCKVTISLPFPLKNLTAVTDAVHTVVPGKRYKRTWSLVEGDYHQNEGSWTLLPFGDGGKRTLVIYQVLADPKVAIPASIQKLAQTKSIPKLFEHLRATTK